MAVVQLTIAGTDDQSSRPPDYSSMVSYAIGCQHYIQNEKIAASEQNFFEYLGLHGVGNNPPMKALFVKPVHPQQTEITVAGSDTIDRRHYIPGEEVVAKKQEIMGWFDSEVEYKGVEYVRLALDREYQALNYRMSQIKEKLFDIDVKRRLLEILENGDN